MKRYLLITSIVLFSLDIFAQQEIVFSSQKLQEISQEYAGDALNWPVVVSLAEHDITANTFKLSPSSLLKLRSLSNASFIYETQNKRVQNLIGEGATIFATNQLAATNQLFKDYLIEIKNGNLDNALSISAQFKPSVDNMELNLNRNRLVSIQAQLKEKNGTVDKRRTASFLSGAGDHANLWHPI
jgi:hypothetical protein